MCTTSDSPVTSCSVWINNIQKHLLFPQGFGEFPEWKRKKFNYITFGTSLIIILQKVKYPLKVEESPMDFNAREDKILVNMISDSMLQLTLNKLPNVEFGIVSKQNIHYSLKMLLKYPSIFLLHI